MPVSIDSDALKTGFDGVIRDAGREAADHWFAASQDRLAAADSQEDDSNYSPILQSGYPPEWDEGRQAWVFTYSHLAAIFAEWGTDPHRIQADEAEYLLFEWEDIPSEVADKFRPMWEDPGHFLTEPQVLFKEVMHPGTPEIRYVRGGRDDTIAAMSGGGGGR